MNRYSWNFTQLRYTTWVCAWRGIILRSELFKGRYCSAGWGSIFCINLTYRTSSLLRAACIGYPLFSCIFYICIILITSITQLLFHIIFQTLLQYIFLFLCHAFRLCVTQARTLRGEPGSMWGQSKLCSHPMFAKSRPYLKVWWQNCQLYIKGWIRKGSIWFLIQYHLEHLVMAVIGASMQTLVQLVWRCNMYVQVFSQVGEFRVFLGNLGNNSI